MVIVGHLGGIDEIGVFVVPAILAVLALRWAERRAQRRAAEGDEVVSHPVGGSTGEGGEGGSPV